jgi:glycine/D-amino acid oxidase-like deaminating enzyme
VTQTADVVIIGAGIIGGSIAFHLLERDPRLRVVMLEKEATPGTGATSKATGGVRFQFSTEANVRLTQLSTVTSPTTARSWAARWTSSATAISS